MCILFTVNKKIGMIAVLCIISQLFIITRGLNDCTQVTLDEYKNKDLMYEYIEDLFSNINISFFPSVNFILSPIFSYFPK